MSIARKLMQVYFDVAYNRLYDFTTARLGLYRRLQERCVSKLELKDNDKVLCVGLGTGNEVLHILQRNKSVDIVGVDCSRTALQKAYRKALMWGKEIEVLLMDARQLEFAAATFDKVLCLHVTDFIEENTEITSEILRVLKEGGQFVITYPSEKESAKLGANVLKDSFHCNVRARNCLHGVLVFLAQMAMGCVYLPLLLRKKRFYSRRKLEAILSPLTSGNLQIEEYPAYQDFIVFGRK